jgi:tetratricopeptide (TPR) repeat protein
MKLAFLLHDEILLAVALAPLSLPSPRAGATRLVQRRGERVEGEGACAFYAKLGFASKDDVPGGCFIGWLCYRLGVNDLLIGLLSALVATNQPAALSNFVTRTAAVSLPVIDPHDPTEREYRKLLESDDAAQAEVDKWIKENEASKAKDAGSLEPSLQARILQRLDPVQKAYEDFLKRHPDHIPAHLAFGAFLHDRHDEEGAVAHWEKARELDPRNADAWNNLANHYSHSGPLSKAFEYFAKAIELNPDEAVYYQNFANTVGLFRKDAMEFYQIDEQGVFRKALDLYRQGLKLDSTNFTLASDLAQIYYGIKPVRTDEAIAAWEYALKIAPGAFEREGVHLHLARFKLNAERFEEARRHVTNVTNAAYLELKQRLLLNLEQQQNQARNTNAPPSGSGKKP